MRSNQYSRDYILEEKIDPVSGRIRTAAVYQGEYFAFTAGEKELRHAKKRFAALTVLIAAACVSALAVNAPCAHVWYCNLPFVLMVLPVWIACASCLRFVRCRQPLNREWRDKTCRRYVTSLIFIFAFSLFALAGNITFMILYNVQRFVQLAARTAIFPCAALIITAASGRMLSLRRVLDTACTKQSK